MGLPISLISEYFPDVKGDYQMFVIRSSIEQLSPDKLPFAECTTYNLDLMFGRFMIIGHVNDFVF
jgi:hypothetical protein